MWYVRFYSATNGATICGGDSGGPLYYWQGGKIIAAGIIAAADPAYGPELRVLVMGIPNPELHVYVDVGRSICREQHSWTASTHRVATARRTGTATVADLWGAVRAGGRPPRSE
jgi:hypothetical protein